MARQKRASWFKLFSHQRPALESVSDADAGQGLKATFRYFDGEDINPALLSPAAYTVFCVLRPGVDESILDYANAVQNGRNGGNKRWKNQDSPPIPPNSPPIGVPTEVEVEADAEADTKIIDEERMADKPPRAPRFSPPSVEDVRQFCSEIGAGIDAEAFVDYYTANGWVQGKGKPIKDWKAAVRTWARRENQGAQNARHAVLTDAEYLEGS